MSRPGIKKDLPTWEKRCTIATERRKLELVAVANRFTFYRVRVLCLPLARIDQDHLYGAGIHRSLSESSRNFVGFIDLKHSFCVCREGTARLGESEVVRHAIHETLPFKPSGLSCVCPAIRRGSWRLGMLS